MKRNKHDILMQEAVKRVVESAEFWVNYITDGGKTLPIGASPETKGERAQRLAMEAGMLPQLMAENPQHAQDVMAEINRFMGEEE